LIHDNNTAYHIMTNRPPRNLFGREVLTVEAEDGKETAFLNHKQLELEMSLVQPKKQSRVVFTKPFFPRSYTPPVNNPWRMYGKKLNSDPVIISDQ